MPLASAAEIERDDPAARLRATRAWRGDQDAAGRWRILQEAQRQRDRWSIGVQSTALRTMQAVQGGTFVSIGPERADFEANGAVYHEIDSGRARQVIPHPWDPNILYLSTAGGGVWKSWDAGAGWEPITDALGTTAVGTLAMDPVDPDILYLGFGDPFDVHQPGLVKSTDAGATWSDPVLLVADYGGVQLTASVVTDIKIDPRNSSVVLATTDVGLFRSTDGGATFRHLPLTGAWSTETFFYMWSLAWAGNDTWLATGQLANIDLPPSAGANAGRMGLWRSTDDGQTWQWDAPALPGGNAEAAIAGRGTFAAAPSTLVDPSTARVYLLAGYARGDAQLDLFRTDDGGQSFVALGMNAGGVPLNPNLDQGTLDVLHQQAWYNQAITVDPQNADSVLVGGDLALVRSSDGGYSWSVISDWLPAPAGLDLPYVHADLHSLAVGPDGTVWAGSDGGIFTSANALTAPPSGVQFSSALNQGLVTHLVFSAACAPETWPAGLQGFVAGGLQDNGTRVRSGSTPTFNQVLGGDGIGVAVSAGAHFDPVQQADVPDALLASAQFNIFRSTDGGRSWASFYAGMGSDQLPFFVRVIRDTGATDGETFVTFTGQPPAVYASSGGMPWRKISGYLRWPDGTMTAGFVTPSGALIELRNLAAHPGRGGLYGAVSNKFAYVTADGGEHWTVSQQPAPGGSPAGTGAYLLSSIAFDPADISGGTYYVTTKAMHLASASGGVLPLPESFGHLYKTVDGGQHWTPLGAQPTGSGGLPFVPFDVVKVDPGDSRTLYAGTELGLYRSADGGSTWARFGAGSLPLVEVTDLCISPASQRLTAATFGRGFWQIGTGTASDAAGVRGTGDTNFDQRIDGRDLIDLADAFGSTQASPAYRWQADLTGTVNAVDADDLAALLAKFGRQP